MSHIRAPFTLPKYPELLHDLNAMQIQIKLHTLNKEPAPSWDSILELLNRSYNAINEQREDPRKY